MKNLALLCLLLLSGCALYEVKNGPPFKAVVGPRDRALVYLYRPAHLPAWMRPVHVVISGQERIVMVEGYAVMSVAPGHHAVVAYSTGTAQHFVTIGIGGSQWSGDTGLDAVPGTPVYVRLTARFGATSVEVVDANTAKNEISQLHLSAGGALR